MKKKKEQGIGVSYCRRKRPCQLPVSHLLRTCFKAMLSHTRSDTIYRVKKRMDTEGEREEKKSLGHHHIDTGHLKRGVLYSQEKYTS